MVQATFQADYTVDYDVVDHVMRCIFTRITTWQLDYNDVIEGLYTITTPVSVVLRDREVLFICVV